MTISFCGAFFDKVGVCAKPVELLSGALPNVQISFVVLDLTGAKITFWKPVFHGSSPPLARQRQIDQDQLFEILADRLIPPGSQGARQGSI
jgi:hypothetical protein